MTRLPKMPNDLYGVFAFLIVPPGDSFQNELHMQRVWGVVSCYTGSMGKAEEVFKPIFEFLDEMPVLDIFFDGIYLPG